MFYLDTNTSVWKQSSFMHQKEDSCRQPASNVHAENSRLPCFSRMNSMPQSAISDYKLKTKSQKLPGWQIYLQLPLQNAKVPNSFECFQFFFSVSFFLVVVFSLLNNTYMAIKLFTSHPGCCAFKLLSLHYIKFSLTHFLIFPLWKAPEQTVLQWSIK